MRNLNYTFFLLFVLILEAQSFAQVNTPAGNTKVIMSATTEKAALAAQPETFSFKVLNLYPQNISCSGADVLPLQSFEYNNGFTLNLNQLIIPSSGIYHFDAHINFGFNVSEYEKHGNHMLYLYVNGSVKESIAAMNSHTAFTPYVGVMLSCDEQLSAGDQVSLRFGEVYPEPSLQVRIDNIVLSGHKLN